MGEIQRNNKGTATIPVQQRETYQTPVTTVKTDRSALRNTEAGLTKAQQASVLEWEDSHRNYKREHMAIVGPDGSVNPKGDPQGSSSSTRVAFRTDRLVENGVLIHNHPSEGNSLAGRVGIPLSGQDIFIAAKYNLAEVRAVTPNYVYSIKRPANGWGNNANAILSDFNLRYRTGVREAQRLGSQRLGMGLISSEKDVNEFNDRSNVTIQTQIIRDLSKKYGFRYSRRKSS